MVGPDAGPGELVRLEEADADGVALLVLHNPPVNALSWAVQARLGQVLDELAPRRDVRVVVVAGAGPKVFSAGAEISELDQLRDPVEAARVVAGLHRVLDRLEQLPQVTIAAVDGAAAGGGTEVALACTLRVAGPRARLGLPEVGLGVIPGGGGTQRLPAVVGRGPALELVLDGRLVDGAEAARLGLVHRHVAEGTARDAALGWAAELAGRPRVALWAAKRAVLAAGRPDGYQVELAAFVEAAGSDDMVEGVGAFLDRRPPAFTHR